VLAGATNILGLVLLYRALSLGKVSVAAPIASTEGLFAAIFAVTWFGETVRPFILIGLIVISIGVVVVTFEGKLSDVGTRSSTIALCAAAVFGVSLASTAQAGSDLGSYWTILIARIIGICFLALPLLIGGRLRLTRQAAPLVAASGVLEVVGFVFFVEGAGHSLAVTSVLASQFAVVATLISVAVLGERMLPRQIAGVTLIAVGVASVALAQAI
jgi:drug/metabolite transporter (DMT)-like permease